MVKVPIILLSAWLLAILLAHIIGTSPNHIQLNAILALPNTTQWLGTDDLGRSILPRLVTGAEISLLVAVLVSLLSMIIGIPLGLIAGYFGGVVDTVVMQVTDIFMAFPGILLGIAFAAVMGPGITNLVMALGLTGWVSYARITRAQTKSLRNRQHVMAAMTLGASTRRIICLHIFPLLLPILMIEITYSLASVMIAEASLSFLGIGIPAPQATWGSMLRDAVRYMLVAPHYVLIVGMSMMSLIFAINLGGDYLRDKLDVRT